MHRLDAADLATILAALRFYQRHYKGGDLMLDDIATDGGTLPAADAETIDELCDRIYQKNNDLPLDS